MKIQYSVEFENIDIDSNTDSSVDDKAVIITFLNLDSSDLRGLAISGSVSDGEDLAVQLGGLVNARSETNWSSGVIDGEIDHFLQELEGVA